MLQHSILGISLGSRSIGIAVMRNERLIDWQIKSFADAMNEQKLHIITGSIVRLIRDNDIASLVLKLPLSLELHANLVALKKHLLKTCASKGIAVTSYTLSDIKALVGEGVCNKQELAACMVTQYPELRFVYMKEQHARNSYYLKLFEAVAVLHIHTRNT